MENKDIGGTMGWGTSLPRLGSQTMTFELVLPLPQESCGLSWNQETSCLGNLYRCPEPRLVDADIVSGE